VEGFDTPEGFKGRWMLAGVYGPEPVAAKALSRHCGLPVPHNQKIRDAIDTIGKKGVLLLGRFTSGRITVLERLRDELRKRDFLPIIFNFDKPETKNFTETVRLLAGMSRFVIVDITNPRSAPLRQGLPSF